MPNPPPPGYPTLQCIMSCCVHISFLCDGYYFTVVVQWGSACHKGRAGTEDHILQRCGTRHKNGGVQNSKVMCAQAHEHKQCPLFTLPSPIARASQQRCRPFPVPQADKTRVMDYINRLDNYDAQDIAKIAEGAELYEEAHVIYKKFGDNVQAIRVLLDDIGSIERGCAAPAFALNP